jgi:Xaa-Pro aminopeptidase
MLPSLVIGARYATMDPGQREAWDLFVAAYRTALEMVKPGRTSLDVFAAWQAEFERRRAHLKTAFGKRTAEVALSAEAAKFWVMHGSVCRLSKGSSTRFRSVKFWRLNRS